MDEYKIVSCDFHDQLEAAAVLKQTCELVFNDERGHSRRIESKIAQIIIRDKAEFLVMNTGEVVRLDKIISFSTLGNPKET